MTTQTLEPMAHATCAKCPYFQDFGEANGRGWCGVFDGCVAKTGGNLVGVAFVLSELSGRYLIHEPQTPIQVASFPIRYHPVVRSVVLAVST